MDDRRVRAGVENSSQLDTRSDEGSRGIEDNNDLIGGIKAKRVGTESV